MAIPSPNEPPIFSALRTALPSVTSLQLTSAPQGGTYVVVEFPEATVRTLVPGNSTVSEAVNLVAASCATALGRARRRAVESAVRAVASPAGYDLVSVDREGDSWVATATHPSSGRVSATVPAPDVRGGEAEAVGAALHAALSAEVAREAATADVRAAVTRVVSGTWVGRPRVVSGKSVGRTVTLTLSWLGAQETGSTEAQEGRADEAVAELARRLGDRVRVGAIDRAREAAAGVRLLRTTVDVRADERLVVVFRDSAGAETTSLALDSESADVAGALVRSAALRSAAERLRRETEAEVAPGSDLRLDAEATLSGISVAISCGPVSSVLCVPPDAEPGDILVPEARRVAAARAEVEKRRRFRAAVAHASSALGLSAGKLVDEVTQKHPDAVPADLSADELRQWAVRNGVSVGGLRGVEEDTRCLVEAKGRVWPGGSWCAELSSVTGRRGVRDAVEVVARANYLAAVRAACRERGVVLGPSRVEGDTTLVETDAGVTVGVKRPETWRDADVARAVEAAVEAATLAVTRPGILRAVGDALPGAHVEVGPDSPEGYTRIRVGYGGVSRWFEWHPDVPERDLLRCVVTGIVEEALGEDPHPLRGAVRRLWRGDLRLHLDRGAVDLSVLLPNGAETQRVRFCGDRRAPAPIGVLCEGVREAVRALFASVPGAGRVLVSRDAVTATVFPRLEDELRAGAPPLTGGVCVLAWTPVEEVARGLLTIGARPGRIDPRVASRPAGETTTGGTVSQTDTMSQTKPAREPYGMNTAKEELIESAYVAAARKLPDIVRAALVTQMAKRMPRRKDRVAIAEAVLSGEVGRVIVMGVTSLVVAHAPEFVRGQLEWVSFDRLARTMRIQAGADVMIGVGDLFGGFIAENGKIAVEAIKTAFGGDAALRAIAAGTPDPVFSGVGAHADAASAKQP